MDDIAVYRTATSCNAVLGATDRSLVCRCGHMAATNRRFSQTKTIKVGTPTSSSRDGLGVGSVKRFRKPHAGSPPACWCDLFPASSEDE